jgi:membrane protease YdiL (CAAX protease family)
MTLLSFWQRLPVIVRSVITGALMATAGTVPWAILASLNIKYLPAIPWAVLPTALYLWMYWRFATGAGWPRSGSGTRRGLSRVNQLSGEAWGMALLSGALGLGALVNFSNVMNRLVRLPKQPLEDLSAIPFITVLLLLIMSAVVAGLTEEISFRGYMQGPIERRHGPVAAILITGSLFGIVHFTHPETTLALMPFYIGVAIIYGTLAWLTNSVLPGMVLHAGGNMLAAMSLVGTGRSEWQTPAKPPSLIWETGPDASFWLSCILFLVMTTVTIWAYRSLATAIRREAAPGV